MGYTSLVQSIGVRAPNLYTKGRLVIVSRQKQMKSTVCCTYRGPRWILRKHSVIRLDAGVTKNKHGFLWPSCDLFG